MFSIADSLNAAKRQGKEYESLYKLSQKSPNSPKYSAWRAAFITEKDETETEDKKEKWEECRKLIETTKHTKLEEAKRWADSFDKDGKRTMRIRASENAYSNASKAQISYIKSLVESANITNNKIKLNVNNLSEISVTQASMLISALLKLKEYEVPSDMTVTTNLDQYIADDTALQNDPDSKDLVPPYIAVEQTLVK